MTMPNAKPDQSVTEDHRFQLWSVALTRPFLRRLMGLIERGRLTVTMPDGETLSSEGTLPGPHAAMTLTRLRALRRLIFGGDIGLAEAYRDHDFETPDLTALIELGAVNDTALRAMVSGTLPARIGNRLRHLLNSNTRRGSKRNIEAHYDLGNAFYQAWLDPSMTYSSAIYTDEAQSLEEAQQHKLDRIVAMLDLKGGERVLEIGCGWGALAERLAQRGCHVTGITLSPAQLAFAQDRIAAAGLSDKVDLRLQDYRDVREKFDRIVSIEMIEAVGRRFWPSYFGTLQQALELGGKVVLQAITIEDRVFESYASGTDFIQRYIFPGGCLPSPKAMAAEVARAGLVQSGHEAFGASYARTLAEWRKRFQAAWPQIAPLGFDDAFKRIWEFYLCYCEAGFGAGTTDVGLFALEHAAPRG